MIRSGSIDELATDEVESSVKFIDEGVPGNISPSGENKGELRSPIGTTFGEERIAGVFIGETIGDDRGRVDVEIVRLSKKISIESKAIPGSWEQPVRDLP